MAGTKAGARARALPGLLAGALILALGTGPAQAADPAAPPRLPTGPAAPANAAPAPATTPTAATTAPAAGRSVRIDTRGSSDSGPTGDRREPRVQRRVVEDDRARIEELRVRGAVQRMTVTPKGGAITTPYEVQPTDAGRDFGEGPSPSRTGGQRTWRVLSF